MGCFYTNYLSLQHPKALNNQQKNKFQPIQKPVEINMDPFLDRWKKRKKTIQKIEYENIKFLLYY